MYIKSVLLRGAKRLSYIEDARCLKVKAFPNISTQPRSLPIRCLAQHCDSVLQIELAIKSSLVTITPPGLKLKISAFCPRVLFINFRTTLKISSHNYPVQHSLTAGYKPNL